MEFNALVLRNTSYRDSDAMVTAINSEKSFSFLARGVRKSTSKNAFSIVPLTYSHFDVLKTKEGFSLKTGFVMESFPKIRDHYEGLMMIDFLSELTIKLIPESDYVKAYKPLTTILHLLEDGFDHLTLAIIYFAFVLNASGYGWNVDSCQKCGHKEAIVACNHAAGGFICRNCFDGSSGAIQDLRLLKIIRYIFKVEPDMYSKIAFEKEECLTILKYLDEFTKNTIQFELKSIKLLQL